MLNRMRTDAKTCHYLVIIWIYTVKSLQERTFFLIVMYFYFQILSQEDPTLRQIYYDLLTMLDVTWGIFLDEDGWAARSSAEQWGQGRRTEELDCSALYEQQTERSSCWERFQAACLFCIFIPYIFLQVFAWPPFENNNLLLSDRPSATFCPFSAPFEEFLTNLEEALVVLRAWLLKLVLTDSAGKMWTAFSVALGSSSGQWLSEGSTRDHWSDLEEHVFLRKQHNN